jgi:hypothetical protein
MVGTRNNVINCSSKTAPRYTTGRIRERYCNRLHPAFNARHCVPGAILALTYKTAKQGHDRTLVDDNIKLLFCEL